MCKFFYKFFKSLMSAFLLNDPRTEILATPLQYRPWEEFMYEILSDVLPRTNILEPLLLTMKKEKIWSKFPLPNLLKFSLLTRAAEYANLINIKCFIRQCYFILSTLLITRDGGKWWSKDHHLVVVKIVKNVAFSLKNVKKWWKKFFIYYLKL